MAATRWEMTPQVPTLRELGHDVIEGSMRGMAAPAGLPAEVLARLALSVRRTVDDPAFQEAARSQSLPLRFLDPAAYLRDILTVIADQPIKRIGDRLAWNRNTDEGTVTHGPVENREKALGGAARPA
jgi:tripartite-type tricarboxylate transporter receptor subunit TctC